MVSLRIQSDEFGLPERPPTGFWTRVAESPAVLAGERAALSWFQDLRPIDATAPMDVRRYVDAATQPIANLRQELAAFGFPNSEYLGEVFERQVAATKLAYYRRRNTASLIVEFARDARFRYILTWTPETGGPRTAMNVCITPSSLLVDASNWAAFVTEWVAWSYPYFRDGGINVVICPEARATIDYAAALVRVQRGAVRYT